MPQENIAAVIEEAQAKVRHELQLRDHEIAKRDYELQLRDQEIQRLREQLISTSAKKPQREYTEEELSAKLVAEERASKEADSKVCSFYFVNADQLRATTEKTLPCFQELLQRGGWIQQREVSATLAYRHRYVDSGFLAVSHRWENFDAPDAVGKQLEALKAHLHANHHIKWVWYDYWCMPQGEDRTPADQVYFKWMLKNVNLLYLGAAVLLVVDNSYPSRFWVYAKLDRTGTRPDMQLCADRHARVLHARPNSNAGSHSRKALQLASVRRKRNLSAGRSVACGGRRWTRRVKSLRMYGDGQSRWRRRRSSRCRT